MASIGINYVRLAEFAWSRLEPAEGKFNFDWLDRAFDILTTHGLKIILCTPTATPPSWLVHKYPQILPYNERGNLRNFGSRHHYSFNSDTYRELSCAIVEKIARRYGQHPALVAWQTDNEYGCHNSVHSYGPLDLAAFRSWLQRKYGNIEQLNSRWGNAFWSMEYASFDQIEFPHTTVAEANPAHSLDFARFFSAAVIAFNRAQVQILRQHSRHTLLTHNLMGFFMDFDAYELGNDLDIASFDNYPLGLLDSFHSDETDKLYYHRTGHPDISAFFYDLYRSCGKERLWIMEQQPGPVNWAPHNPIPLADMVHFWSWQAFAHGADLVGFFRWRQIPYGQEQMHAALVLANNQEAPAYQQVQRLSQEIKQLPEIKTARAAVALLFDYETVWLLDIQPQGNNFRYFDWVFACYQSLRLLGLNVDFVSTRSSFENYKLIIIPSLPIIRKHLCEKIEQATGHFLWGPRSGSKTEDFQLPANLAPGPLTQFLPLQIPQVESLRDGLNIAGTGVFGDFVAHRWRERITTALAPLSQCTDGYGAFYSHGKHHYLATMLTSESLHKLIRYLAQLTQLGTRTLPMHIRCRTAGELEFFFNFGETSHPLAATQEQLVLGSREISHGKFAAIKKSNRRIVHANSQETNFHV